MRQVKRLARPGRAGPRRRPPPRLWVRKLRKGAAIGLTAVIVAGSGYAFVHSSLATRVADVVHKRVIAASVAAGFVVNRVYSEGRTLAGEADLARTLETVHGHPLFSVELGKLKEQIEALPWVRSASIGRRLPDTLWIRLDEHRPVARWMDGTRQVLVSDAQEVFRVKDAARYKELPLLFGKGAPARSTEVLQLAAAEPELAGHVTGARLVGGRRWDIYLDGRIEVRLPADRPARAWRRLAAEQRQSGVITRAVTSIDLRNPDWLTLELPETVLGQGKEPRA